MATLDRQYITWGSFSFPFNSLSVDATPVYADDRRTRVGTTYTFNVSGVLTAESTALGAPAGTPQSFRETLSAMRTALGAERQVFRVREAATFNGSMIDLFYIGPAQNNQDWQPVIDWGPYSDPPKITRITGGLAARYTWSCRATLKDCGAGGASDVVSHTKTYRYAVDADSFLTRTVRGTYRIKAQAAPADRYRAAMVPPQPDGFKRLNQDFQESADQLETKYIVVDRQVHRTLPKPITSGQAVFSVTRQRGGLATMSLRGFMAGGPATSVSVILQKIGDLVTQRLPSGPEHFYEQESIQESIYDPNRVDFSFVLTRASGGPAGAANGNVGNSVVAAVKSFGTLPPECDAKSELIDPYGTGKAKVSSPLVPVFDSCSGGSGGSGGSGSSGGPTGSSSVAAPTNTPTPRDNVALSQALDNLGSGGRNVGSGGGGGGGGTAEDVSGMSEAHQNAPYVEYYEMITIATDHGWQFFDQKETGKFPIKQRVRNPIKYGVQVGFYKRMANDRSDVEDKPEIAGMLRAGEVIYEEVSPSTPEPQHRGEYDSYRLRWKYVVRFEDPGNSPDKALYPDDPRRPA